MLRVAQPHGRSSAGIASGMVVQNGWMVWIHYSQWLVCLQRSWFIFYFDLSKRKVLYTQQWCTFNVCNGDMIVKELIQVIQEWPQNNVTTLQWLSWWSEYWWSGMCHQRSDRMQMLQWSCNVR